MEGVTTTRAITNLRLKKGRVDKYEMTLKERPDGKGKKVESRGEATKDVKFIFVLI